MLWKALSKYLFWYVMLCDVLIQKFSQNSFKWNINYSLWFMCFEAQSDCWTTATGCCSFFTLTKGSVATVAVRSRKREWMYDALQCGFDQSAPTGDVIISWKSVKNSNKYKQRSTWRNNTTEIPVPIHTRMEELHRLWTRRTKKHRSLFCALHRLLNATRRPLAHICVTPIHDDKWTILYLFVSFFFSFISNGKPLSPGPRELPLFCLLVTNAEKNVQHRCCLRSDFGLCTHKNMSAASKRQELNNNNKGMPANAIEIYHSCSAARMHTYGEAPTQPRCVTIGDHIHSNTSHEHTWPTIART